MGAGEAIKGWVPRRAESFEKLDKVVATGEGVDVPNMKPPAMLSEL
ncbi:unnamed protein product [Rhodiola kirilowii]